MKTFARILLLLMALVFTGCYDLLDEIIGENKENEKPVIEDRTARDLYDKARGNYANPYMILTPDDVEENVIVVAVQAQKASEYKSDVERKSNLLISSARNFKAELMLEEYVNGSSTVISRSKGLLTKRIITESDIENEFFQAVAALGGVEFANIASKTLKAGIYSNWSQIDDSKIEEALQVAESLLVVGNKIDAESDLQEIGAAGRTFGAEDILEQMADLYKIKGDSRKVVEMLSRAENIIKEKTTDQGSSKILDLKVKMAETLIEAGVPEQAAEILKEIVEASKNIEISDNAEDKNKAKAVAKGLQQLKVMAEAGVDIHESGISSDDIDNVLNEVKEKANTGTDGIEIISNEQLERIKEQVTSKIQESQENAISQAEQDLNKAYSKLALKMYDEVIQIFTELLSNEEVKNNSKYLKDSLFGLATAYMYIEDLENAIETFKRVSQLIPEDSEAVKIAAIEISKLESELNNTGDEGFGEEKEIIILPPELNKFTFMPGEIFNISTEILYIGVDQSDDAFLNQELNVYIETFNELGEKAKDVLNNLPLKADNGVFTVNTADATVINNIGINAISGKYTVKLTAKEISGDVVATYEFPIFVGRIAEIKEQVKLDSLIVDAENNIAKISLLNYDPKVGVEVLVKGISQIIGQSGEVLYQFDEEDKSNGEHELLVILRQNAVDKEIRAIRYKKGIAGEITDTERAYIIEQGISVVEDFVGEKDKVMALVDIQSGLYERLGKELPATLNIIRNSINATADKYGNFAKVTTRETIVASEEVKITIFQEYKVSKIIVKNGDTETETWKIREITFEDILFEILRTALEIDTDGDGLLDIEEEELGTNPNLKDSDNDGYSDAKELNRGTDPIDPLDFPFDIIAVQGMDRDNIIKDVFESFIDIPSIETGDLSAALNDGMPADEFVESLYQLSDFNELEIEALVERLGFTLEDLKNQNVEIRFLAPEKERYTDEITQEIKEEYPAYIAFVNKLGNQGYQVYLNVLYEILKANKVIAKDNINMELIGTSGVNPAWKLTFADRLESGFYIPDILIENDGVDNDGDGLIDEEFKNQRDDDGDGLIDEDIRESISGTGIIRFSTDKAGFKQIKVISEIGAQKVDGTEEEKVNAVLRKFGTSSNNVVIGELPLENNLRVKVEFEDGETYVSGDPEGDDVVDGWLRLTDQNPDYDLGNISDELLGDLVIIEPENEKIYDLSSEEVVVKWNKAENVNTYAVVVVVDPAFIENDDYESYTALKFIETDIAGENPQWIYTESSIDEFVANFGFAKKLISDNPYYVVVAGFKETGTEIGVKMQLGKELDPVIISEVKKFGVESVEGLINVSGKIVNNNYIPYGAYIGFMTELPEEASDAKFEYLFRVYGEGTEGWNMEESAYVLDYQVTVPVGTYYIGSFLDINNNGTADDGEYRSQVLGEGTTGLDLSQDFRNMDLYLTQSFGGDQLRGELINSSGMKSDIVVSVLEYIKGERDPHGVIINDTLIREVEETSGFSIEFNQKNYPAYGIEAFLDVNGNRIPDSYEDVLTGEMIPEPTSSFKLFYENGEYLQDIEKISLEIKAAIVPGDGIDNDKDGQVDEEFANGIDDDGDGRIDEDTRKETAIVEAGNIVGKVLLEGGLGTFTGYEIILKNAEGNEIGYLGGGATNGDGSFDIGEIPTNLPEGEKVAIFFVRNGYQHQVIDVVFEGDSKVADLGTIILKRKIDIVKPDVPIVHWDLATTNLDAEVMWTRRDDALEYWIVIAGNYDLLDQGEFLFKKELGTASTYTISRADFEEIGTGFKLMKVIVRLEGDIYMSSDIVELNIESTGTKEHKVVGKIVSYEPINQKIQVGLFQEDPRENDIFAPKYVIEIEAREGVAKEDGTIEFEYEIGIDNPQDLYVGALVDYDLNGFINQGDLAGVLPYRIRIEGEVELSETEKIKLEKIAGNDNMWIVIDLKASIDINQGIIMLGLFEENIDDSLIQVEYSYEPSLYHQEFERSYDFDLSKSYALQAYFDINNNQMIDQGEAISSQERIEFDSTGRVINRDIYMFISDKVFEGSSKLRVRVNNSDGTATIGTIVDIYNPQIDFKKVKTIGENGLVEFVDIPEGKYEIKVKKEGYPSEFEELHVVGDLSEIIINLQDEVLGNYALEGKVFLDGIEEKVNTGFAEVFKFDPETNEKHFKGETSIQGSFFRIEGLDQGRYQVMVGGVEGYPTEYIEFYIDDTITDTFYIGEIYLRQLGEGVIEGNITARDFDWGRVMVNDSNGNLLQERAIDSLTGEFYVDGLPVGQSLKIAFEVQNHPWYEMEGIIPDDSKKLLVPDVELGELGNKRIELVIENPELIGNWIDANIFEMEANGNMKFIQKGYWNGGDQINFEGLFGGNYQIELTGDEITRKVISNIELINEEFREIRVKLEEPIEIILPNKFIFDTDENPIFEWSNNNEEVNTYAVLLKKGGIDNVNVTGPEYFDTAIKMFANSGTATMNWEYQVMEKAEGELEFALGLENNVIYGFTVVGFEEDMATLKSKILRGEKIETVVSSNSEEFMKQSETVGSVDVKLINTLNKAIPYDGKIMVAILKDYLPMDNNEEPREDQIVAIKDGVEVSSTLLPGSTIELPSQKIVIDLLKEIDPNQAEKGYVAIALFRDFSGEEIEDLFGVSMVHFDSTGAYIEPIEIGIGEISEEIIELFRKGTVNVNFDYTAVNLEDIDYMREVRIETWIGRPTDSGFDGIAYEEMMVSAVGSFPESMGMNIFEDFEMTDDYEIGTRIFYADEKQNNIAFAKEGLDLSNGLPTEAITVKLMGEQVVDIKIDYTEFDMLLLDTNRAIRVEASVEQILGENDYRGIAHGEIHLQGGETLPEMIGASIYDPIDPAGQYIIRVKVIYDDKWEEIGMGEVDLDLSQGLPTEEIRVVLESIKTPRLYMATSSSGLEVNGEIEVNIMAKDLMGISGITVILEYNSGILELQRDTENGVILEIIGALGNSNLPAMIKDELGRLRVDIAVEDAKDLQDDSVFKIWFKGLNPGQTSIEFEKIEIVLENHEGLTAFEISGEGAGILVLEQAE